MILGCLFITEAFVASDNALHCSLKISSQITNTRTTRASSHAHTHVTLYSKNSNVEKTIPLQSWLVIFRSSVTFVRAAVWQCARCCNGCWSSSPVCCWGTIYAARSAAPCCPLLLHSHCPMQAKYSSLQASMASVSSYFMRPRWLTLSLIWLCRNH